MNSWIRWMRSGAVIVLSVGGIVVLLIWLARGFHEKIQPGPTLVGTQPLGDAPTVAVEQVTVPFSEDAVGTVRAVHETELGAKIMARVLAVHFQAGQHVEKDQVLLELARGDLEARLSQARAAVEAARYNAHAASRSTSRRQLSGRFLRSTATLAGVSAVTTQRRARPPDPSRSTRSSAGWPGP